MNQAAYKVKLAKTLHRDIYRAILETDSETVIGKLRVLPVFPLERNEVPEKAPVVLPFLLVIVDDADINKDTLIDFEERASYSLLKKFATDSFQPQYCQFYYPSPAFIFEQPDSTTQPLM